MQIDAQTLYEQYVATRVSPDMPRSLPTLAETLAMPGVAIHGGERMQAIESLLLDSDDSPQMQRRAHEKRYYAIFDALSYGIGGLPLDTEAPIVLDAAYLEALDHTYQIYFYGFGQPQIVGLIDMRGGPTIPLERREDGTAVLRVHPLKQSQVVGNG